MGVTNHLLTGMILQEFDLFFVEKNGSSDFFLGWPGGFFWFQFFFVHFCWAERRFVRNGFVRKWMSTKVKERRLRSEGGI